MQALSKVWSVNSDHCLNIQLPKVLNRAFSYNPNSFLGYQEKGPLNIKLVIIIFKKHNLNVTFKNNIFKGPRLSIFPP